MPCAAEPLDRRNVSICRSTPARGNGELVLKQPGEGCGNGDAKEFAGRMLGAWKGQGKEGLGGLEPGELDGGGSSRHASFNEKRLVLLEEAMEDE